MTKFVRGFHIDLADFVAWVARSCKVSSAKVATEPQLVLFTVPEDEFGKEELMLAKLTFSPKLKGL